MNQEDASLEQPRKNVWVYFWAVCSAVFVFVRTMLSWLLQFYNTFWNQNVLGSISPLNLFFLCKIVLPILGPLYCHMNFRIGLLFFRKPAEILTAVTPNLWIYLERITILTILSLKTQVHIPAFVQVLFNFSRRCFVGFGVIVRVFNIANHLHVKCYLVQVLVEVPDHYWDQASFE